MNLFRIINQYKLNNFVNMKSSFLQRLQRQTTAPTQMQQSPKRFQQPILKPKSIKKYDNNSPNFIGNQDTYVSVGFSNSIKMKASKPMDFFKKEHQDLQNIINMSEFRKLNPQNKTPKRIKEQVKLEIRPQSNSKAKEKASILIRNSSKENIKTIKSLFQKQLEQLNTPKKNSKVSCRWRPKVNSCFETNGQIIQEKTDEKTNQNSNLKVRPFEIKPVTTPSKGKKGLLNAGNTCYMNAVLQCLFHISDFNIIFSSQQMLNNELSTKEKGVAKQYFDLYNKTMKLKTQSVQSALSLKISVSKICSMFIDHQQEDAYQFMLQLFDALHYDLSRVSPSDKSAYKLMQFKKKDINLWQIADQFWQNSKKIQDSIIYDLVCGQVLSNVLCTCCQQYSYTFQNFLDLSLSFYPGKNKIQQLLETYFTQEELSDDYFCSTCQKSRKKARRKLDLWRLPKILIIHLKRSDFSKKNKTMVTFPVSKLNMKPYLSSTSSKGAVYGLTGIVNHRGQKDTGHYWAEVKDAGAWYKIDDEKIENINEQDIKSLETKGSSEAYLLIYSSLI